LMPVCRPKEERLRQQRRLHMHEIDATAGRFDAAKPPDLRSHRAERYDQIVAFDLRRSAFRNLLEHR